MARVNHKKVKQLLNEKRSKISDRQFFTSRILAGHFEDLAAAQTKRYKYNSRIHVNLIWKPRDGNVACTNNLSVLINAGNKMVTKSRSRMDRYELVSGLFAHELGHCLYTDFLAAQTYDNYLSRNIWYPEPPILRLTADVRNEKALWNYVKADPQNNEMLRYIAQNISNIVEDGYVESRILSQFPGTLGHGLEALRERHMEDMLTVTQLIEREEDGSGHIFESVLQILLSYVKYGEIKYGEEPLSDERIQRVFKIIPDLDSALINPSSRDHWNVVNLIMVRCWDYLEDFLELCKKRQEEAEAAGASSSVAETLSEMLQSIVGSSAASEGDSTPVPEDDKPGIASNAGNRAQTHALAKKCESASEEEGVCASPQTETEQGKPEAGADKSEGENAEMGESKGEVTSPSKKQDVSSNEEGRIPYQQTNQASEPSGGSVENNDTYEREHYERVAADIERLLEHMAEKAACKQLENDRIRELNDAAQNISYGNIHTGVKVRVNRIDDVDEELVEQYDAIAGPLLTISKQLQKSLIQQLKDRQRGGKQTSLMMGRRLDAHALCRNDGRVFYKNTLPNEIPEMSIGLLLDESGSMSSCDRCTYARASAIILYDFCRSLRIPVMVYGHSTGYDSVELYSYAEFENFDNDDKYRMIDVGARGSNRDGAALRFVAEQLTKRPEEIKILILVSDGQPADSGYGGSAAEEDLRGIKQEYRRKGILFVAAAIGDDKQNIERIYGDSFMDITDLNQLPVKLTSVVKRHMRA